MVEPGSKDWPPGEGMTEIQLWKPLAAVAVNGVIGIFFLLAFIPAVWALYERGYGRFSAMFYFAILPLLGLCLSAGVSAWLCWLGTSPRLQVGNGLPRTFLVSVFRIYRGARGGDLAFLLVPSFYDGFATAPLIERRLSDAGGDRRPAAVTHGA